MVIYAEEIFILNFAATFILYLAVCVLFDFKISIARLSIAGAISGLYAVLETVFGIWHGVRTVVMALSVWLTFGRCGFVMNMLRVMNVSVCAVLFTTAVNMLLCGDTLVSGGSVVLFADGTVMGIAYLLAYPLTVSGVRWFKNRRRFRRCVFEVGDKTVYAKLLYDSGNLLSHNGLPVAVLAKSIADSVNIECDGDEFVRLATIEGIGKLPLIKPDKCIIDGVERDIYIAVSEYEFNGCGGLIGV